jgi:integrase
MDREAMPLYRRARSAHWWVRIGRKTRRSTGTADRAEAEEFEERLRQRLWRLEKLGDRGAITWKEAAERWLADSARPRARDREFLKWLAPSLDQEPVSAVADPDTLEQLRQDARTDGWAPATIDRMMTTVRAILHKCVAWRLIETAPAVPMYRPASPEPRWITREQFDRLRKELPPHLKLAASFAVHTMLRMRAMGQLTWDRVDLRQRRAWVPSGQMKGGRTFGFPLSRAVVRILRQLKTMSPKGERVFQFEGRPIDNFNTKAFKKAAERAGLLPLRWHDLRHTGASWAVQHGVTLQELMVLGDWKSYVMVLKYAHLAPSHAAKAAEMVGRREHTPKRGRARHK